MRRSLGEYLKKIATELLSAEVPALSQEDADRLNKEGPELIRKVQDTLGKGDLDAKALKGMSKDDKRLLLAYIVYVRENVTTEATDNPNAEDAARILHGDVYSNGKKQNKELEDHLLKQLQKAGIKPNKGD